MTVTLGPLVVDAVEPRAVESFWAAALGGPAQRGLLSFRQQRRAKTVKNRVHLDVYVRDVEPLLELGAPVLAEYRPQRVTLADVEGNEFCAFLDPALDDGPPARAFAVCTDGDRPEELAGWWAAQVGAAVRKRARRHLALALRLSGLGGPHLEVRPRARRTGGPESVAVDGVRRRHRRWRAR